MLTVPVDVRFRDIDAVGHVNNAVYLTYLEQARLAYWMKLTGKSALRDIDIILARVEIDYRSPIAFGENVEVAIRCVSMKRTSCVLELRLTERVSGRLVAEARNVLVYFDYKAQRPQPIPEEIRALIRAQDPGVVESETGGAS